MYLNIYLYFIQGKYSNNFYNKCLKKYLNISIFIFYIFIKYKLYLSFINIYFYLLSYTHIH